MGFGERAFSGSRFIFWCLAPVLALSALVPACLDSWTLPKGIVAGAWSSGCVLAIFALRDARRFWWAARGLTALIFLAHVGYLVSELASGRDLGFGESDSSVNPLNAALGLIGIGVPCLWYTVFGRFTRGPKEPPEEASSSERSP